MRTRRFIAPTVDPWIEVVEHWRSYNLALPHPQCKGVWYLEHCGCGYVRGPKGAGINSYVERPYLTQEIENELLIKLLICCSFKAAIIIVTGHLKVCKIAVVQNIGYGDYYAVINMFLCHRKNLRGLEAYVFLCKLL